MSRTIAVGVVGPSHWAYMAAVMAKVFNQAVQKSCLAKADMPAGVLVDAARLSRLILEEAHFKDKGSTPSNPPATINAYIMAKKAVEKVVGHYPSTEEFEPLITGCQLIVDLKDKAEESRDIRILKFMSSFFLELSKMGEEERSARFGKNDLLTEDDE